MNWRGWTFPFFCVGFTMFILPGVPGYADVPESALIGAWLFDEGQGNSVNDASGNGNRMRVAGGAPEWVEGKFGNAMQFDGSADYLAASDSPSLNSVDGQAMSIVAWMRGTGLDGSLRYIISRPLVYWLAVQNRTLSLYLCTETDEPGVVLGHRTQGNREIRAGEWVHLAMVYDGADLRGYINGEEDASLLLPAEGNIFNINGELRIGGDPCGPGDPRPSGYFAGVIDEVALFKTALTEDQIEDIMEAGLPILTVEPSGNLAITWGTVKR